MRANALADRLLGKGRGAILGLLYGHPARSFFYREITRQLPGLSVGTIQRELDTLTQLELINRSTIGKQVFYQANRKHPIFSELRALLAKTVGVFELLRFALAPYGDRICVAFVYGSMARQEEGADSDVDVMIVGQITLEDVLDQLSHSEEGIGRPINPTVYSVAEFKSKLAGGNHFLTSVVSGDKVFLIGDEHELGKLCAERLDLGATNEPRRNQKHDRTRGTRNR
jgi:DNA-binding HxlR family transcriptional regulator